MNRAKYNGVTVAYYAYDVLGRRIVRYVLTAGPNNATTGYYRFIYRGGQVTAEADYAGTLTLGYTWGLGPDDLVGVRDYVGSQHYYVVQDGLRTARALSRRDGTWTAAFRHRAYGVALDSAGSVPFELRYRWIGREFDEETGLYYLRARYYDPNSQRFTQEDPIGFGGGANVYAYADGNPINGRDLDGMAKDYEYTALSSADPNNPFAGCTGTWDGCSGGAGFDAIAHAAAFGDVADELLGSCRAGDISCLIKASGREAKSRFLAALNDFAIGFGEAVLMLNPIAVARQHLCKACPDYSDSGSYAAGASVGEAVEFMYSTVRMLRSTQNLPMFARGGAATGLGRINHNNWLRIGWGWHAGRGYVFRVSVGGRGMPIWEHINLWYRGY